MKTAATYYIEVDTYWQNSKSYFVGPFPTRATAETWYADTAEGANVWLSTSICGGDIKSAWRIYPTALSKTVAIKRGMRNEYDNDYNVLDIDTKPTANALSQARRELEIYA